ncbi:MAG: hypothetical protein K1X79_09165 [Oligoflexia bacterium]|nr:hypothetical protein [Oligoflexia bacterium]
MIPPHYRLVYNRQQIAGCVKKLGAEIAAWSGTASSDLDVVMVPVLRGGIFFFSDLVREMECSVDIAPLRASVYEKGKNAVALEIGEIFDAGLEVNGRTVVIVDDVCDSGKTLSILSPRLKAAGAREVKTCVLIQRILPSLHAQRPDWVGFEYSGPEWFVGYGMDDAGRYRNLPDIYVMEGQGS